MQEKEEEKVCAVEQSRVFTFPSLAVASGITAGKALPWWEKWAGEKHWTEEERRWHNQSLNRVALV